MKVCTKCLETKDLEQFSKNKSKPDGLSSNCKSCHRLIRNKHYSENKEAERKRTKDNKEKVKEKYLKLKSSLSCQLCGESHIAVLQFHHLDPDTKDFEVSKAIHDGYSFDRVVSEINKCAVLCANCHFKEHYNLKEFGTSLL